MKFKILDHEPIYLAGVVHYGALDRSELKKKQASKRGEVHLEKDEDFQRGVEELRTNASKLRDQLMDELKFHSDHFSKDYRNHRKQWKSESDHDKASSKDHASHKTYGPESVNFNFESAINGLGGALESFGRYMENNAGKWEDNIKVWSKDFEKNMENFGERMDAWGDDFGKRMEDWGNNFGEPGEASSNHSSVSIKSYLIYRTYQEIFKAYIEGHKDHIKQQTFYEVQILDTSFEDVTAMTMIGSRMSSLAAMVYPVATMSFKPYKWVAIKLTPEEYAKDWIGSLEKVEQLAPYKLESYFIVRHKVTRESDEIRLFCPISEKSDER